MFNGELMNTVAEFSVALHSNNRNLTKVCLVKYSLDLIISRNFYYISFRYFLHTISLFKKMYKNNVFKSVIPKIHVGNKQYRPVDNATLSESHVEISEGSTGHVHCFNLAVSVPSPLQSLNSSND